jgi:hypothetical protein
MMGHMSHDPRLISPTTIVDHVKGEIGWHGGVTWGMSEQDIIHIIQRDALMAWSSRFPLYLDHKITIREDNRIIPSQKGVYYHGLPEGEILIGVEKVYPGYDQPGTFMNVPNRKSTWNSGVMDKAQKAMKNLGQSTVPLTAVGWPEGQAYFTGVKFDPAHWINETGETIDLRLKLAHALDFSTIGPDYIEAFKDFAGIIVCRFIVKNIFTRLDGMMTEVGQYNSNHISQISETAGRYDEMIQKMNRDRMYHAKRVKVFKG